MKFNKNNISNYFGSFLPSYRKNSIDNRGRYTYMKESGGGCSSGGIQDMGNADTVINLRKKAMENSNFRTALWTGKNLQLTIMNLAPGEDIGFEMHEDLDQMIGVISGTAEVVMGKSANSLRPAEITDSSSVIMIPGGTYHNVKNAGRVPLKLYSVYAPKAHPFGTNKKTKQD